MRYRFLPWPELYWSVLTSAATVLLLALVSFDPATVADWRAWLVALGSGMLRSAAGAALDWLRRQMTDQPEPTLADEIMALPESERVALRVELERRRLEAHGGTMASGVANLVTRPPEWLRPDELPTREGKD